MLRGFDKILDRRQLPPHSHLCTYDCQKNSKEKQCVNFESKYEISLKTWIERTIIVYEKLMIASGPIFRIVVRGKIK